MYGGIIMTVSFQATNFSNVSPYMRKNNSKSVTFGRFPTPQSIEREKRYKRGRIITTVAGTAVGATIGALGYSKKIKAGTIGGIIGFIAGSLAGNMAYPYIRE